MTRQKAKAYPWDRWFKKKRFTLVRGVHYECMTHSMAQQVRDAACQRGVGVHVKIEPVGLPIGIAKIRVEVYQRED